MKSKKGKKSYLTLPWRLLKRYLANCNIHGLKYLVQEDCHWSERIFWLICCGLSWWGCSGMVLEVLAEFLNRPVATTIETNYLQWEARMPSIHFCSKEVLESKEYAAKAWLKSSSMSKLMDITTWGFVPNLNEPHDAKTFEEYSNSGVMNCNEFIDKCTWNDKPMNCCEVIVPLRTPIGHCLSFNSLHTNVSDDVRFKRTSDEPGVFVIYIKEGLYFNITKKPLTTYILDRMDLPSTLIGSEKKLMSKWTSSEMQVDVNQEPTYNVAGVRDIAVEKRHCRFPEETQDLKIFKTYGYDACVAETLASRMLDMCGCVTHIIARNPEMPVCNLTGLACINARAATVISSQNISCWADCEETTFDFFTNVLGTLRTPILRINMLFGPAIRYRRYIVHSKLDLVVAVGGAVGLFIGASVLSLVEIPYWFIVRGIDDDDEDDAVRE